MTTRFFRLALILGLLSAIGPFAIDMYLPALPSIGADLHASIAAVQMSLLVFFVASGVTQLVVGPLSDMFGRKLPLYVGLGVFAAGGVGAALAPSIEWLIAFRVLQGMGACAGMVVPRAIVRDLHTGPEATRLMAMLMLVFSISPILAPLTGSLVIAVAGWRAVFWAVTAAALAGIVLVSTLIRETRPPEARRSSNIRTSLAGYWLLLRDRNFLGLVMIGSFGISSFFVYLANSSFVMIDHFGLTPSQYSLLFSTNAISFFAMAQLAGRLSERLGLRRLVRIAVTGYALAMVATTVAIWQVDRLEVMVAMLFVGYGFLGLVMPTTTVLAMDEHGAIAGTASALMGTLQIVVGGLAMFVSSLFFDGTTLPMVAGIALCAVLAFVAAQTTLGRRRGPVRAAAE